MIALSKLERLYRFHEILIRNIFLLQLSTVFTQQLLNSPKDLLILIQAVLEFSGFYLFEQNISQLKIFTDGYRRCADLNDIRLINSDVLEKFNQYLFTEFGKEQQTPLGCYDFSSLNLSDTEKFNLFKQIFNKFINDNNIHSN